MRTIDHDFHDDGGTPAWRAAHSPTFAQRVARIPFWKVMLYVLFWAFVGPMMTGIISLVLLFTLNPADTVLNGILIWLFSFSLVLIAFIGSVSEKLGYSRKGK